MPSTARIAYVITRSDTVGGAHVHVRDLAQAAVHAGHDVRVLVGGNGPYVGQLEERDIPVATLRHIVRPIRPVADILAFRELRRTLTDFRPDLVSVHSSKAGVLCRMAVGHQFPIVFTAHGWSFTDGVPKVEAHVYRALERALASRTDHIVAVSANDLRLAVEAGIAHRTPTSTIINAVHDVRVDQRVNHGVRPTPHLISVARLDNQKDHPLLFRALARLRGRNWSMDLVGDGPRLAELTGLARELGIEDRIRFLGLRDDVADLLAHADVFLLISNWEGLPRSIIEAFRADLPVIASDVGGVAEQVVEETGWLVPKGDVDCLTSALSTALADSSMRARKGAAARREFEDRFSFGRLIAETYDVYDRLLGRALRRPDVTVHEA